MDRQEIATNVKDAILEIAQVKESQFTDKARFEEDLGIDELSLTDIILKIEDAVDIILPDDAVNVKTVGGLIDLIVSQKK